MITDLFLIHVLHDVSLLLECFRSFLFFFFTKQNPPATGRDSLNVDFHIVSSNQVYIQGGVKQFNGF